MFYYFFFHDNFRNNFYEAKQVLIFLSNYRERTRTIGCIRFDRVLLSDESWSWGNWDFNFLARILSTRDLHKTLRYITNNLCCQIFSLLRWITKLLKIQLNRLFTSIKEVSKKKGQNDKEWRGKSWSMKKNVEIIFFFIRFMLVRLEEARLLIWSLSIVIVKIWRKSECQAERCRKNGRIRLRIVFIRRGCKNRRSDSNPASIDFASKNWNRGNNDSNNWMQRETLNFTRDIRIG